MSAGLFDLTGRVALVMGSTRGIGAVLAGGLARAGATVVVHGRDAAAVETSRASLHDAVGTPVHAVAFDVTDEAAVAAGVAEVAQRVGPVDVLVNNAGVQHREPLVDVAVDDWERVLRSDLTSAFLVGRTVARSMLARGTGKVINVCSVQTELARATIGPYTAAKGGLRNLTRAMCAEWAGGGVQVNAVAPGYFRTDMTAALVADEAFSAWLAGRTPAGRWGDVDELVGPVVFLASAASSYVHGQVLFVDGGMTVVV